MNRIVNPYAFGGILTEQTSNLWFTCPGEIQGHTEFLQLLNNFSEQEISMFAIDPGKPCRGKEF